jgi:uncharacterized repeat protein (TIGR04138 family)
MSNPNFESSSNMIDSAHPIAKLLKEDRRYKLEAYALVFEALNYAHKELGMGTPTEGVPSGEREEEEQEGRPERHLTGQELCEAIRRYALEQYGLMSETVLRNWGVTSTGDFGEIVFNLIRIGQMRKTTEDKREDFNDVYDFQEAFRNGFRITLPQE